VHQLEQQLGEKKIGNTLIHTKDNIVYYINNNKMNVYFATSPSKKYFKLLADSKVDNILISFNFFKSPKKLLEFLGDHKPKRLIIDSGAFSVWSMGSTIDTKKYIQFCLDVKEILPKEIEFIVVNLDVLPGKWGERPTGTQIEESAQQGWNNMEELERAGLKVIHVFHQHEDFKWLERIMKHTDYMGVSPANDVSMNEKLAWLNKVFSITRGSNPDCICQVVIFPNSSCVVVLTHKAEGVPSVIGTTAEATPIAED